MAAAQTCAVVARRHRSAAASDDLAGFGDIDRTGAVLDALVEAGANQIMGPSFSWDANDRAHQIARVAAIKDANQRAQFYAQSLGLRVKRVVSIRDGNGYASAQPAPMLRYESAGTQVSPGEDHGARGNLGRV